MTLAEIIQNALCGAVHLRHLPTGGFAVGTEFQLSDGDRIGFYVESREGRFRIVDDGATVSLLEAQGISFDVETRDAALKAILSEYDFEFDPENAELRTAWLSDQEVAGAVKNFISLRLRLQDFLLLHPEVVASTFKKDLELAIEAAFSGEGQVAFDTIVSEKIPDITVDALVRGGTVTPLAIFFGTSDKRILEAQLLRMQARHEARIDLKVVTVLENERPAGITASGIKRAMNHLDRVLAYRGDEAAVMEELRILVNQH